MNNESKKVLFDAEKETNLYQHTNITNSRKSARLQLIVVAICALFVAGGALIIMTVLEYNKPKGLLNDTRIEYNGLTFERVEDASEITALGLSAPLKSSDCGTYLTTLNTPKEVQGCTAYRLKSIDSEALIVVDRDGIFELYRFCYFTEREGRRGQDILDVYGSNSEIDAISCYGVSRSGSTKANEWDKIMRDGQSLRKFEQLFGALIQEENTNSVLEQINQPNAWDVVVTVRYKNKVTFTICLYKELNVITGFRSVYKISDEMADLVGESN